MGFGYEPFGMGFGAFGILFFLMFGLVFSVIVVTLIRGISQWNKNNHSPRLTVEAKVVAKRGHVSRHNHGTVGDANYHTSSSTTYYVTFQVASGDRMELMVSGNEYGMLVEGDFGDLTFQGTRYLDFARK